MATLDPEERLTRLEVEFTRIEAEIKQLQETRLAPKAKLPWWERIRGTFKNDPAYAEAMRLGREWRQSEPLESEADAA